ncbi:MAG: DHHA1 domain-containing protein [Anaerolineales bacterium]
MNSQLLYQEDVTINEFEAEVIERISLPDGRTGVILDHSYFYPTGGGQEHDTGLVGDLQVVDVYKDEQHNCLVHVVAGDVPLGTVNARIDAERRLRHMQHHTAQHLLTQCILRQTGYETVSANINGYSPSTLDIVASHIGQSDLDQAELLANQGIYEDKLVKTYFVTPEELQSIPLRRPPKVTENIRIVEIDGYDYSPCGGTHVLRTGSIGLVKVLKAERQNDKQRIYFIAGLQAFDIFHRMYDALTGLSNQMSISWQDLPEVVGKQAEQLGLLQKELQSIRQASVKYEAHELLTTAEETGGMKLVRASFENRPVGELRLLAEELKKVAGIVAYLASFDSQKVSLVVTCGEGSGKDARQLLTRQLAHINGRGGGDARLAQGGGLMTEDQYRTFLQPIDLG